MSDIFNLDTIFHHFSSISSIFQHLTWSRSRVKRAKQCNPNVLLVFLVPPKAFSGQMGHIIPLVCPGYSLDSPSIWTSPENPTVKHSEICTPLDVPQVDMFAACTPQCSCFDPYSELMTKGESWNVARPVNPQLCLLYRLPLRNDSPIQRHASWSQNQPPVDLILHLTSEQNPETLEIKIHVL